MAGFSRTRLGRLSNAMRRHIDDGTLAGAVTLLWRNNAIHAEALGVRDLDSGVPMRRDTIFRIASMSKPIAATAAMILVEEARLRLDDPVDAHLPELANRRVLRAIDAALDDTVPAERAITLRDLLTFRLGLGVVMAFPPRFPFQAAMLDAGLMPGAIPPKLPPDEFMRRIGTLPLAHQPGAGWLYHTGSDILGVLIARVTGKPLADFLSERIFEPLGMRDTGFHVPDADIARLATAYQSGPDGLAVFDPAAGGHFAAPPVFASAGGGLVSTVDDFLAFARMLLDGGQGILSPASVALMTRDHIAPEQKAASPFAPGFWETSGWGFGMSVVTRQDSLGPSPGAFGWAGGLNTVFYCDPVENMIGILLSQRLMTSPVPENFQQDFWTLAYQAID